MRRIGIGVAITAALLIASAARAQNYPEYLNRIVPTAPTAGPLSAQRQIDRYIEDGYVIVLRTRLAGRFLGCQQRDELLFEDRTRFRCDVAAFHPQDFPRVVLLRSMKDHTYALFIGRYAMVGRILAMRGNPLPHPIPLGERLVGAPNVLLTERRSIGPVDDLSGKLSTIWGDSELGSTVELSTLVTNPPPAHVSLNPELRDLGSTGARLMQNEQH